MGDEYCYDGQFSDLSSSLDNIHKVLEKILIVLENKQIESSYDEDMHELGKVMIEAIYKNYNKSFSKQISKGNNGLAKTD
jgi:hypothetical protein